MADNDARNNDVQNVRLSRTQAEWAPQLLISILIEKASERLSFNVYKAFLDFVLCDDTTALASLRDEKKISQADYDKFASAKNAGANYANSSPGEYTILKFRRFLPYTDSDAYRFLKVATEAFVAVNCVSLTNFYDADAEGNFRVDQTALLSRVDSKEPPEPSSFSDQWKLLLENLAVKGKNEPETDVLLPYLALIKKKLPDVGVVSIQSLTNDEVAACYDIVQQKLAEPCLLELIWSYWHEEGMLVQTMNAISRRFQNVRGPADKDPLAMLEIGYLRPLNNLLWGYLQDEQHRLTLVRRAYEYDHHYGLTLEGKALPALRTADSRSKFLEAFHNLLHLCTVFFQQDDDTTVKADGFPVLNALKDVHMLLAEGAHNQFGDLPSTARIEMLMQMWLLARPEFRELLPTRESVVYPEPWMERVDAMKKLQGWTDTSVMHFRNLGTFGEQILLSIRFTEWSAIDDPSAAVLWTRFWRAKIQGYIYAYRAVTGVDLTADVTSPQELSLRNTQPSVLLRQRLDGNGAKPMLPARTSATSSVNQLPTPSRSTVRR